MRNKNNSIKYIDNKTDIYCYILNNDNIIKYIPKKYILTCEIREDEEK